VRLPPGFRLRLVTVEPGIERIYNQAEWRDTLVVVASGELELESVDGDSYQFGRGCILCLDRLAVRALRTCGGGGRTVLVALSRADESPSASGLRQPKGQERTDETARGDHACSPPPHPWDSA
jgi:hypothetical protein